MFSFKRFTANSFRTIIVFLMFFFLSNWFSVFELFENDISYLSILFKYKIFFVYFYEAIYATESSFDEEFFK